MTMFRHHTDERGDELIEETLELYLDTSDDPGVLSAPPPLPPWPEKARKLAFISVGMGMGGSERHLAVLANELANRGYDCTVMNIGARSVIDPMEGSLANYVESDGADVHGMDAVIAWADVPRYLAGDAPFLYTVHSRGHGSPEGAAAWPNAAAFAGVSGPISARVAEVTGRTCHTMWNGSGVSGERNTHSGDAFVAGFMGRFTQCKNILSLVKALTVLPDNVRVRLYGYGPYGKLAYESAAQRGVEDRLDLCGVAEDIERAYAEMDCLVIPSVFEGFPMVCIEAMLCGVPVVAVPHGDLPLFANLGLIKPIRPDYASIASGIIDAMSWPTRSAEMAARAKVFASEHLTADAMCRRYAALIEGVIEDGR